jgi:hypothetical protein
MSPQAPLSEGARRFAAQNGLIALGPTILFFRRGEFSVARAQPVSSLDDGCSSMMFAMGGGAPGGFEFVDENRLIKLPALPAGGIGQPMVYYMAGENDWRRVPNQRFVDQHAIYVIPNFFGYYQVFAAVNNLPFAFGEVYVYPNPARAGKVPTLHVEVGAADEVSTRVYDAAGDVVFETKLSQAPTVTDGKLAYELAFDPKKFKSGVYIGVVTAKRAGRETIRRQYRFTIVK